MKRLMLVLILVMALAAVTAPAALAQDEDATYVVSGSSAVNARSCPRLDCAVVATIGPGEIISVVDTVSGDTVSGSDQWRRVVRNGVDAYVHSTLLTARPADQSAADPAAVVTDGWVEHSVAGVSIRAPGSWLDIPESESSMILTDPATGSWVSVFATYTGMDETLTSLRISYEANLDACGCTVFASEITDIPAGETLRLHYQWEREEDRSVQFISETYSLVKRRTTYSIFLTAESQAFEDLAPIFETMIETFAIDSAEAARMVAAEQAGEARVGDNAGALALDGFQLWTYEGEAGDVVTISAVADRLSPVGLDTRLVVRTPGGAVLAENDDSGSLGQDSNASISELELPRAGTYEIEVHTYSSFTSGAYTLVIELGSGGTTAKNRAT